MASGTKNKNWVVSELVANDNSIEVVKGSTKLKVDVDLGKQILRLYFPGAIEFADSDYQASQGSRLATDMRMSKSPDDVLLWIELGDADGVQIERTAEKTIEIEIPEMRVSVSLASKFSTTELLKAINSCRS